MSPIANGIGQSTATLQKQEKLREFLAQHINTVSIILNRHKWASPTYQYIDAYAGCGYNDLIGCPGSPVIFLQTVTRHSISYFAHCIEVKADNASRLVKTISTWPNQRVVVGSNSEWLPHIIDQLPKNSYGLLYCDPTNNLRSMFTLLAEMSQSRALQYIDILIRCPASAVKRNFHQTGTRLQDYLTAISKKTWVVQEPDDRWQWTFLLGMNWDGLNAMRSQGWYYAHKGYGSTILKRLNHTKKELKEMRQPSLIETSPEYRSYAEYLRHPKYRVVRAEAIERAGGTCERCEENSVTEVHHLQYPTWGDFDQVENLLAVCHRCHCEIHGKEN